MIKKGLNYSNENNQLQFLKKFVKVLEEGKEK